MVLCNSNLIQINEERGEYKLLKDDIISIHLNPMLFYPEILYNNNRKAYNQALQDALLNIRSYKIFNDLLKWEKWIISIQSALKSALENSNEATRAAMNEITETKGNVKLELHRLQLSLFVPLTNFLPKKGYKFYE